MDPVTVDTAALWTALDTRRATEELSWRQVAEHTGMSPSNFSRLRNHAHIGLTGYVTCCRWLGVSADTYLLPRAPDRLTATVEDLATTLAGLGVPQLFAVHVIRLTLGLARSARHLPGNGGGPPPGVIR